MTSGSIVGGHDGGGTALGARLRARRRQAMLSQEELAERSGLSVRTVGDVERGRIKSPQAETLRRLDNALRIACDERQTQGNAVPVLHQLPPDVAEFIGRPRHVHELIALLTHAGSGTLRTSKITGPAGVGKTALAIHVAHQVRQRYPDGQLYVDLLGMHAEPLLPSEVLARFLGALGIPRDQLPEELDQRAALYRSALSTRQILVVLDNAADEEQVRPLAPSSPDSAMLVTSRSALAALQVSSAVLLQVMDRDEWCVIASIPQSIISNTPSWCCGRMRSLSVWHRHSSDSATFGGFEANRPSPWRTP